MDKGVSSSAPTNRAHSKGTHGLSVPPPMAGAVFCPALSARSRNFWNDFQGYTLAGRAVGKAAVNHPAARS